MPLLRCQECRSYSLKDTCPRCGAATADPAPAKFSPEDRYGEYRRKLKLEQRAAMKGESE